MKKEALFLLTEVGIGALALYAIGLCSFTSAQREWIRKRDGNKCNFPDRHRCTPNKLQVHHIKPQRYCAELGINADFEQNALTVCEYSHQNLIHPDMEKARKEYAQDKTSYKKTFEERSRLLKEKHIYWCDKWDRQMSSTAIRNSQRWHGDPFPDGHKK